MAEETRLPVLLPDEIVPFFINIVNEDRVFFEIVQIKLCDAEATKMKDDLTKDLELPPNSSLAQTILSFLEGQIEEYKKLTEMYPETEWAEKNSAVHIILIEASTDSVIYCDQFEWDIFDRKANIDAFTRLTIEELGLPAEFVNTFSAQIRHQIIKYRAMHCFPDRLMEYTKTHPLFAPQSVRGFRPVQDLLDVSPVVGIKPGRETKNSNSSIERDRRAQRRHNKTNQLGSK